MAQMGTAFFAHHFDAPHAVREIFLDDNGVFADRREEAWPARAGFEFRLRAKQWVPATHAIIYPGSLLVVIFAGTGSLSSFEAANLELLRRQLLHPLLLRLNNFFNHAVSPKRPRDRAAHCLADFAIFQLSRQVHGES